MDRERPDLEAAIAALADRLGAVERRLAEVEGAGRRLDVHAAGAPVAGAFDDAVTGPRVAEHLPLVGRTLLVLGGGFVLRSITEVNLTGRGTGVALGILYALAWLVFADRAAAAGRRTSAAFHGLSTALVGFPLIWEGSIKFAVFGPALAAILLGAIAGAALAIAARRELAPVAWIATAGSVATALALAIATKALVPFAAYLIVLGLVTLWLEDRFAWHGLGWSAAAAADGILILMAMVVLVVESRAKVAELMSTGALVGLLLALAAAYLGTFAYRTLARRADLRIPEMIQGLAALAIGFGGAGAVARRTGELGTAIGMAGLALAAGCYAVSFAFIDKQAGHRRNFIFYSSVALLLSLAAFGAVLPGPRFAIALAALGVACGVAGARRSRATLSLHAAVYATIAAFASGTIAGAVRALLLARVVDRTWITSAVWAVLAATAVLCVLPVALHGRTWGRFSRAPKLVVLLVFALAAAGAAASFGGASLARAADQAPDPAALAVLRTAIFSVAAVLLALLSRRLLPEAGWLVYPVLVAGGIKLLIEDFRLGRPATLVVSLALYGGALILAPRLHRKPGPDPAD